jgi:UDP-3-O-[3-hydroxymyristoyl] glucosamine N-acyltransferase
MEISLAKVAEIVGGEVKGDVHKLIRDVAPFDEAHSDAITFAGHLNIGDNAIIGPQAGIAKSVPSGEVVSGSAAMPHRIWLKLQRILPTLPEFKKRLAEVEKRLRQIEKD